MTKISQEMVTRIDFTKFWNSYFPGRLGSLTREDLGQAKDALLGEGVPPLTVYAYFQHLARMVSNELGDGRQLGMIEQTLADLERLA
ncbi:MAG: hypothetical protein LZF60_340157 [Nitrospira sp.]|nr:MAG: hypothetical protein LZF60_340157 [Nitrospira sp.]